MARVHDHGVVELEDGAEIAVNRGVEALEGLGFNMFKALANSTHACRGFSKLAARLTFANLPRRVREAVILRIAALLESDYEWGGHVPAAARAGLTDVEIDALRAGELHGFSAMESAAIRFAEAVETRSVDDVLWRATREHFDERQRVELTVLAGFYALASKTMVALDVELEPGWIPLPRS